MGWVVSVNPAGGKSCVILENYRTAGEFRGESEARKRGWKDRVSMVVLRISPQFRLNFQGDHGDAHRGPNLTERQRNEFLTRLKGDSKQKTDRKAESSSVCRVICASIPIAEESNETQFQEPLNRIKGTGNNNMSIGITLKVGSSSFDATLEDNPTSKAFAELLPVTLSMKELNGNEKYCDLSTKLPTKASKIGSIKEGDLLLYGNDCIVVFYESFKTTYSYTPVGKIGDPTGLKEALGKGDIDVRFELK